jgi:biopolymer transport protein ExbD
MNGIRSSDALERQVFFQRRFLPTVRPYRGMWISLPLLTVILLFYLFIVLNEHFVLRPGIVVNLPVSPFVSGIPHSALVVSVTRDGSLFFQDEPMRAEQLAQAFAQAVVEHPNEPLIIEADVRTPHYLVTRICDMAMAVGVREVLLATKPPSSGGGAR